MIDRYPKCYNKYIIQNKSEYYDEQTKSKKTLYIQAHVNKTSPETCKWH